MKIDGKEIASKILQNLKKDIQKLKNKGIALKLAIILAGGDPASAAYVRQKELKAEEIGAKTTTFNLKSETRNSDLKALIKKLNNDNSVHGIIVQQPLPSQINLSEITNLIDPKKDVDGFHPQSQFEMPLAMAVLEILKEVAHLGGEFKNWLKSKKIIVIGKGETGGKPIANMFKKLEIKPLIIDSKTKNPESITKTADIIISAVGKPYVLRPEMLKRGVILIGIGISRGESAKLMGDYDQNKIKNIASFYTPTPGGVGPVNVAMLLKNLTKAADNFTR